MSPYPHVKSQLSASQIRTVIAALCLFQEQYTGNPSLQARFQEHFQPCPALPPNEIDALVGCLYRDLDGLESEDDELDEAEVLNRGYF